MANEQMVGAGEGALSGAAAGATIGSVVPGVGTAIGAGVGALAGGALGYLGSGSKGPKYDQSWFDARSSEINDYESKLNGARAMYLSSLGNMYNDAYSRFSLNAEPNFANRGLSVDSGAFAQSLAYKSAEYSAQLAPTAYAAQREDLNNVDRARGNLFSTEISAKTGGANMGYQTGVENSRAMGGLLMNSLLEYGRNKRAPMDEGSVPISHATGGYDGFGNPTGMRPVFGGTTDKLGLGMGM